MGMDLRRTLNGALAGASAAGVWAAQQPLDKRVFGTSYDDVELLGKLVTRGSGWPARAGDPYGERSGIRRGLRARARSCRCHRSRPGPSRGSPSTWAGGRSSAGRPLSPGALRPRAVVRQRSGLPQGRLAPSAVRPRARRGRATAQCGRRVRAARAGPGFRTGTATSRTLPSGPRRPRLNRPTGSRPAESSSEARATAL